MIIAGPPGIPGSTNALRSTGWATLGRRVPPRPGLSHMAQVAWNPHTRGGIIAKAAAEVAESVGAKYVVAFTVSGDSAKRLSRYRGPIPVLAFTPQSRTRSQLALTWGVETFQGAEVEHTDEMVRQVDEALIHIGRVKKGDLVVIIAGSPPGIPGSTNALRIHRMGDAIDGAAPPTAAALTQRLQPDQLVEPADRLPARDRDGPRAGPAPGDLARSSAQPHSSRMSSDRLVNCHRG